MPPGAGSAFGTDGAQAMKARFRPYRRGLGDPLGYTVLAMRILLVEDHPELARWVAKALRDSGLAVDHVSDGTDADHVLGTEDYALVILDLTLPGLDGLEVLKRLRTRKQTVPVLV